MKNKEEIKEIKYVGFYVEDESKFAVSMVNQGYYREVSFFLIEKMFEHEAESLIEINKSNPLKSQKREKNDKGNWFFYKISKKHSIAGKIFFYFF